MIIPGLASQAVAASLATETGRDLMPVTRRQFPDGERLVELEADPGTAPIIVASTVSSAAHMDLLLLQDAAREAGATELTTVIPYLGYARQDTDFADGQPVSVRAIARAIAPGTDRVLTVNPHETDVLEYFDVPSRAVSVAGELAEALSADLLDPVFLGPDEGARALAHHVRDAYGRGTADHLEKTRHSDRAVEIAPSDTAVADRDVVLVDDIISTGGTMCEAANVLDDRGANELIVTCVHPMLAEDAYVRLRREGVRAIYGTDTIERTVSVVSAAPAIAESLESS